MSILVTPLHGGQAYDGNAQDSSKDSAVDRYMVTGTTDIYLAYNAVAVAADAAVGALTRDSIKLKHIVADIWEADVSYTDQENGNNKKDPDIGQLEWDYDTMGGTQHITQGLAPTVIFAVPGHNPMEFQRAIEANRTGRGQWNVKGTDVVVPKGEVTCTTSFPPNDLTLDWRRQVKKLVGKTNNVAWKVWEKGEMKFLGLRLKARYREKITVTFSFLEAENITAADNVTIGGLNGAGGAGASPPIEMTGHQYLWVYYEQEESNGQVLMSPKQANVETVCREGDFSILRLGN